MPDASRLYLAVGLGFFAEVSSTEAPSLLAPRLAHFRAKAIETDEKVAHAQQMLADVDRTLQQLHEAQTA